MSLHECDEIETIVNHSLKLHAYVGDIVVE